MVIKIYRYLLAIFLIIYISLLSSCNDKNEESERSLTIRLLTSDSIKHWGLEQSFIDEVSQPISSCDSSYLLTLKADFTWEEAFLKFSCNQLTNGSWALNDENNVLSITYISQFTGKKEEKKFEIFELSEDYFTYQYAENNQLMKIRLKKNPL